MFKKKGSVNITYVTVLFFMILISFSINLLLQSMLQKSITYAKYIKNNYKYESTLNQLNDYIYNNDILTNTNTTIDSKNISIQVLNTNKAINPINNIVIDEFQSTYNIVNTKKYLIISNNELQIKDNYNNQYSGNYLFLQNSNLTLSSTNNNTKYAITYSEGQFFIASVYNNSNLEKKYLIYKNLNYAYKVLEFNQ